MIPLLMVGNQAETVFAYLIFITGYKPGRQFSFLQRLSIIFGFRRDCRDLLLPAEAVVLGN